MRDPAFYTVVFRGDVREIRDNLFKVVSPFGEVIAIAIGDLIEEVDRLEAEAEAAKDKAA